jgi:hypothetical protein
MQIWSAMSLPGKTDKDNIWSINTEQDCREQLPADAAVAESLQGGAASNDLD